MDTGSPTPLPSYAGARLSRQPSTRHMSRRGSPLAALGHSRAYSPNASALQNASAGDSSDDEAPAPPIELNPITRALLERQFGESPHKRSARPTVLRISRDGSATNTPAKTDSITPAPSLRIKRVGMQGAPMRRNKRTPQSEDEPIQAVANDQENMIESSVMKSATKSAPTGAESQRRVAVHRDERPMPLASVSTNTPHRPAPPPPPPKMSVVESAAAPGPAATKQKRKKGHFTVNGKVYSQLGKLGRGGSSDVYRVQAESGKQFALKRVKLEEADESAIAGYKGEIELLRKLEDVDRVVRLYDWQVDEDRQLLYVLMEPGDMDLSKILRTKFDPPQSEKLDNSPEVKLDIPFTRFYWKEMLECVSAVHAHDIVHSDLKPANFLLVYGQLKLIDFGIANAIDIENTVNVHRDNHVGTPNYMSPESLQDSNAGLKDDAARVGKLMKLGKPSDVWSLGCILYQLVYGRPPFAHIANPINRVMAIINPSVTIDFRDVGIGGVRVPPEIRRILKRCLNRNPAERPTVSELLSETDPFLYPENAVDLRISQDLLAQMIQRVADRFQDPNKPPPTEEDIRSYPLIFYERIRSWQQEQ